MKFIGKIRKEIAKHIEKHLAQEVVEPLLARGLEVT